MNFLSLRRFTSLILVLILSTHAIAETINHRPVSPSDSFETQEFLKTINELSDLFDDPSRPEHALDFFQLLSQTLDTRELDALLKEKEKIKALHPNEKEIEDFIDTDLALKRPYFKNMQLQVLDESGGVTKVFNQKEQANSTLPHTFLDLNLNQTKGRFVIADKTGRTLHTFHRAIDGVGFFGPFIVYVESGSYDHQKKSLPLRFINLDYFKTAVGNANLPVFTLPLTTGELIDFKIEAGQLRINNLKLTADGIKLISDIYQVYYNVAVALVDPKTKDRAEHLMKEIAYYFSKSLESADDGVKKQMSMALANENGLQGIIKKIESEINATALINGKKLVQAKELVTDSDLADKEKVLKLISNDEQFRERMLQTNRNMQAAKKFVSRIYMLISELAHPAPLGSPKLISAMAMVVEGVLKKDFELRDYGLKSIKVHPYFKYLKFGSYAVGAASIGSVLPEPYTFHLYHALDLSKMIFEQMHGYLIHTDYGVNFKKLYGIAAHTATQGLPNVIPRYFTSGHFPKFVSGLASVTVIPLIVFGVPHFLVNGIKAAKSVNLKWASIQSKGLSRLETFRTSFIEFVQEEKSAYDKIMSKAEEEISGAVKFEELSPEDIAKLEAVIKEYESKYGFFTKKVQSLKDVTRAARSYTAGFFRNSVYKIETSIGDMGRASYAMMSFADFIENGFLKKVVPKERRIETFGQALFQFCVSYPSLTNTFKTLAGIWNYVFITRSFILKPKTWYMVLMYPQYYDRVTRSTEGQIHIPTTWNGGKINSFELIGASLKRGAESTRERLLMAEWEKAILPIEKMVYELATSKALEALIKSIDDPLKLRAFFESADNNNNKLTASQVLEVASPSSGLASIVDPKLSQLSGKDQAYFQAFFTKTFDETMSSFVAGFSPEQLNPEIKNTINNLEHLSDQELKQRSLSLVESLKEQEQKVKTDVTYQKSLRDFLKRKMDQVIVDQKIDIYSNDVATKLSYFFERKKVNYHHQLFKTLDPKGGQLTRFLLAEKQLKNPMAVARAVRQEVASLLVSKPLYLLGILVMYAGVMEGIMSPFHPDQENGPDAFIYMSRNLFYNGFVVGTFVSIMADTWFKVQSDFRVQDLGGFGKVPMDEWKIKPFWRYYFKSLVNPGNKWFDNQIYYSKLIWSNIPAVFVLTVVTNMITLGRFDIDLFLSSYIFIFTTPFMGIKLKIDQAFELATMWVRAQIPSEYRAHPQAMDWMQKTMQKKKLAFSIADHLYGMMVDTMNSLFESMNTKEFGSRSFARLLFYGYTPTELAALGLRKVSDVLGFIPGVEQISNACEHLLTNKYTDWQKVLPKK